MPGLFEQFPHTNLHELNLDWMIDLLNQFKQDLEDRAVISVNGMTGEVTLYESENVVLPPLTGASSWRLVRMMDGQYVGVLFQDGHIWLQQGNSTLKLLTAEDIPTSAGVVSINGMGGIVRLTGADIPIDNSADPDSIRLALENETNARTNADSVLDGRISEVATELENFEKIRTIEVQLFNQTINGSANEIANTVFDLSAYVPTGFSIWSAEVQIQDGSAFYNLPWFNDELVQATWIYTIANRSITIRNKATWNANTSITFTLHCKQ